MPDPKHAHDRRGIHWTFDAPAYVDFVARLRDTPLPLVVNAPSFDHALKDPVPDAIVIQPCHRVVVIEGLYAMLDIDPWRQAAAQMDERWWIQIDPARAKTRLVKRHVQTGVAKDMVEAVWRAENNDEDSECVHPSRPCLVWVVHEGLDRWKVYRKELVQHDVYHSEHRRPCIFHLTTWISNIFPHITPCCASVGQIQKPHPASPHKIRRL